MNSIHLYIIYLCNSTCSSKMSGNWNFIAHDKIPRAFHILIMKWKSMILIVFKMKWNGNMKTIGIKWNRTRNENKQTNIKFVVLCAVCMCVCTVDVAHRESRTKGEQQRPYKRIIKCNIGFMILKYNLKCKQCVYSMSIQYSILHMELLLYNNVTYS